MPGPGFWHLLTGVERDALSASGRMSVFAPGMNLCVEGEPATHLFVVTAGWVKVVSVTRDGQQRVTALRGDGDVVGELATANAGHRTATMRACGRVDALLVSHLAFDAFLDTHPNADHAYRDALTQRFGEAATMLFARTTTSGPQRLAGLLLDLAARQAPARHGPAAMTIEMPLSQEELASLAGTSRATVSRAFQDWRRRRYIRTSRRRITIADPDGLRKIAGGLQVAFADARGQVAPAVRADFKDHAETIMGIPDQDVR